LSALGPAVEDIDRRVRRLDGQPREHARAHPSYGTCRYLRRPPPLVDIAPIVLAYGGSSSTADVVLKRAS
jgi:hypothetical protein